MKTYSALVVTLAEPLDELETKNLIGAILLLRGVLSVDSSESNLAAEHIGAMRERHAITEAVWELLGRRLASRADVHTMD